MHIPPAHADPAFICRMRHAGINPGDTIPYGFEIYPATDTAEGACSQLMCHLPLIAIIKQFSSLRREQAPDRCIRLLPYALNKPRTAMVVMLNRLE